MKNIIFLFLLFAVNLSAQKVIQPSDIVIGETYDYEKGEFTEKFTSTFPTKETTIIVETWKGDELIQTKETVKTYDVVVNFPLPKAGTTSYIKTYDKRGRKLEYQPHLLYLPTEKPIKDNQFAYDGKTTYVSKDGEWSVNN